MYSIRYMRRCITVSRKKCSWNACNVLDRCESSIESILSLFFRSIANPFRESSHFFWFVFSCRSLQFHKIRCVSLQSCSRIYPKDSPSDVMIPALMKIIVHLVALYYKRLSLEVPQATGATAAHVLFLIFSFASPTDSGSWFITGELPSVFFLLLLIKITAIVAHASMLIRCCISA